MALLSKNLVYVAIFSVWTWAWMFWLIEIRGWFVAGSLKLILSAQFLLYRAYAFLSSAVVLATKDLSKSFGIIAVYGGSSLSFAGVTLPLNNAPLFTQFWSNIIPFTPYAKLQTEQWVIGSPVHISLQAGLMLLVYALVYALLAYLFLKKIAKGAVQ
jgi:ABC-2 type transport system permease protein